MEKRYKEIDGVRYQVIQNTILGSNVVPVGESLPEVTASDTGKVLGVDSSGEWAPVDAPSDLPDITGNAGKVLTVSSGASGVEWADVPEELPAVTSADAGDVLTVNASGEWEAVAPGGGGGGLTLYGPYAVTNALGYTISSYSGETITLDEVYDVTLTDEYTPSETAKYLIAGFKTSNSSILFVGCTPFTVSNGYGYSDSQVFAENGEGYAGDPHTIVLYLFSTEELTPAQS